MLAGGDGTAFGATVVARFAVLWFKLGAVSASCFFGLLLHSIFDKNRLLEAKLVVVAWCRSESKFVFNYIFCDLIVSLSVKLLSYVALIW